MKKFIIYIDDGKGVYKLAIPAKNEKQAREYVSGNGEIVAIKDGSDYYISADKVFTALKKAEFGEVEIDFIVRTLTINGIAE